MKIGSKLAEVADVRNLGNACPPLEYVPSGSPAKPTMRSRAPAGGMSGVYALAPLGALLAMWPT